MDIIFVVSEFDRTNAIFIFNVSIWSTKNRTISASSTELIVS